MKQKWASTKRPDRSPELHVVIIGGGRVGQTLGRLLSDQGFVIDSVVCRTLPRAKAARRFTSARRASNRITTDLFPAARIVFITTPDASIAPTALLLSRLPVNWEGKIIFHTSGALSSRELGALSTKGARIASLHPLQTFPSPVEGVKRVKGIFFTFEGDRGTEAVARKLVRALGGRLVKLEARDRPLYHCAGTFACGALLAPLSVAYELYGKIGIDERTARAMLKPIVNATVEVAQNSDLRKTITGPISRGDAPTIAGHIQALSKVAPQYGTLYRSLSLRLLELVGTSISKAKSDSIRRLLTGKSLTGRRRSRRD
ncbi:MAG: DUF2520 domain-containing protein [Acidobacteriia bacterium]|nr:DUF2520 domain-containing protein [Terriglobia bacterium]